MNIEELFCWSTAYVLWNLFSIRNPCIIENVPNSELWSFGQHHPHCLVSKYSSFGCKHGEILDRVEVYVQWSCTVAFRTFCVLTVVLSHPTTWTVVPPFIILLLCFCPLNCKQPIISIWLQPFIRHFSLKCGWVPATSAISRKRDRREKINI